eukprot:scaffold1403_cov381-Prasinococcus_capsulatus_cf.AAC.11
MLRHPVVDVVHELQLCQAAPLLVDQHGTRVRASCRQLLPAASLRRRLTARRGEHASSPARTRLCGYIYIAAAHTSLAALRCQWALWREPALRPAAGMLRQLGSFGS